ncbi:MAG: TRAP transporter small permease [Proteobacteria bacterium]|nr:MAG: TRAP transporter small permease [Pseudomonadota bacterium]
MDVAPETTAEPSGWLDRFDAFLVGGLGMAALLLASVNVILRGTLPHLAIEWGDEVQVYLVIWAVCLSFSAVTARGRHIKADLFVDMMPPALRTGVAVLGDVLGLFVSLLLAYLAYGVTYEAWDFGDVSSTTLRFPIWIYQAALPLGMALMALRYAIRLHAHVAPKADKVVVQEIRP